MLHCEFGVSFPVREVWVEWIWWINCYTCHKSPLCVAEMIQWKSNSQYGCFQCRRRMLPGRDCIQRRAAVRDSGSGLVLGVDSYSLFQDWVWPQGRGGFKSVVFFLDELPSQANKSHLRDANGFKEQEKPAFALSPVGSPGSETEPHDQARRWTWLSEAISTHAVWEYFIANGSLSRQPPPAMTTLEPKRISPVMLVSKFFVYLKLDPFIIPFSFFESIIQWDHPRPWREFHRMALVLNW